MTDLFCEHNALTSLDVSNNAALTNLSCNHNNLASLDVSNNTALDLLSCENNNLTSLDVSKNTALATFRCNNNNLTSLDVSNNTALTDLLCYSNNIQGRKMDKLVNGLPNVEYGSFIVIDTKDENECNVCSTKQVAVAKVKGWNVYDFKGATYPYIEYAGSEPVIEEISPVDENDGVDFSTVFDESTSLDGGVIVNILYSISSENGGYNPEEGCIVLTGVMDDSEVAALEGMDINSDDFRNSFTGIGFIVPTGQGNIVLSAETTGNMKMNVKVGESTPIEMKLEGKQSVNIPYDVSGNTVVCIYGSLTAAETNQVKVEKSEDSELKIYSIHFERVESTAIIRINADGTDSDDIWYTLDGQKMQGKFMKHGIYVHNGKKVVK